MDRAFKLRYLQLESCKEQWFLQSCGFLDFQQTKMGVGLLDLRENPTFLGFPVFGFLDCWISCKWCVKVPLRLLAEKVAFWTKAAKLCKFSYDWNPKKLWFWGVRPSRQKFRRYLEHRNFGDTWIYATLYLELHLAFLGKNFPQMYFFSVHYTSIFVVFIHLSGIGFSLRVKKLLPKGASKTYISQSLRRARKCWLWARRRAISNLRCTDWLFPGDTGRN